ANNVLIDADSDGIPATDAKAFNLTITDLTTRAVEYFAKVTMDPAKSTYVEAIVNDVDNGSQMVSVKVADATAGRPMATGSSGGDITLADVKNDNDYTLKVTSDVPANAIKDVTVTFIAKDEEKPTSVVGICRLLERKANAALAKVLPGAAIRCVPSASGKGIRLYADFSPELLPDALDAEITLGAGTPND